MRPLTNTKSLMALLLVVITSMSACKKLDYDNHFVTSGDVYLVNQTALARNLLVRYNGVPVDWQIGTGLIHGVAGEVKLEFYDQRTGEKVTEKTVNIKASNPERYVLFQLEESAPIAFLDPNVQANEAAAPDGYIKIKIANLTKGAIPDEQIDIVFHSTTVGIVTFGRVDTIENVGRNLETAPYYLVKKGVRNGAYQTRYKMSFIRHDTKQEIPNSTGTFYITGGDFSTSSNPAPKGVYTLYLTDALRTTTGGLKNGDKYYDININVLFKN